MTFRATCYGALHCVDEGMQLLVHTLLLFGGCLLAMMQLHEDAMQAHAEGRVLQAELHQLDVVSLGPCTAHAFAACLSKC